MQPQITKIHTLEMSQRQGNVTVHDSTVPTEENTRNDDKKTRC